MDYLIGGMGEGYRQTILGTGLAGDVLSVLIGALAIQSRRSAGADIVHAWGATAVSAALLGRCRRIIYSPLPHERPMCRGRLAAMLCRAAAMVVCPSDMIRRRFLEDGISADRCQMIRPGVDISRVKASRNAALRAELGFGDSDHVILAPGETTQRSGHREAAWAVGILNVLDSRRRLLVWGRGDSVDALRDFTDGLRQPNLLTLAEHRLGRSIDFEQLPAVADLTLAASNGRVATLPLCICMAAGVPIISVDSADAAELLEDGRTALLRPRATPMMLAQCVLDLEKDATMRRRLSDAARAMAVESLSLPKCLPKWRAVYRAVISGVQIDANAIAV
jgi:glycosyltransferase involved in cell wall biosynthesis